MEVWTMRVRSLGIWSKAVFVLVMLLFVSMAWGQETSANPEQAKEADSKKEKKKPWTDYIKPDLKAFLYYKLDATNEKGKDRDFVNEFGVARAYLGAKIYPADHFMFRITLDAKARIKTAEGESDTKTVGVTDDQGNVIGQAEIPTTEVENSQGAYYVYLKYAYLEAYDVFTKGLYFRLGQGGFIGITQLEDYWTYRYQGPMILDREKYMSSTYIGFSVGYKAPSEIVNIQLSAVNGEGYSHPERQKSKDGQLALFFRPWAKSNGFLHSLIVGGAAVYGKYDEVDGTDRRLRAGGALGFADKLFCLFGEANFVQDPTSEAAKRAKEVAGMETPLAIRASDLTNGFLAAAYGWIDFGLFADSVKGLRIVGRYDYADPNVNFSGDHHDRITAGIGYVFNKYFQLLTDAEMTFFGNRAGYYKDGLTFVKPTTEKLVYLHTQIKL